MVYILLIVMGVITAWSFDPKCDNRHLAECVGIKLQEIRKDFERGLNE